MNELSKLTEKERVKGFSDQCQFQKFLVLLHCSWQSWTFPFHRDLTLSALQGDVKIKHRWIVGT